MPRRAADNRFFDRDRLRLSIGRNPLPLAVAAINILFLSFFYYYNTKTGLGIDDYGYMYTFAPDGLQLTRITGLFDAILSQYYHYFTMNGRAVPHFLLQLALIGGRPSLSIVNTLFYFLFSFGLYRFWRLKSRKSDPLRMTMCYLIPWFFCPFFGQIFMLGCMAANYMWTMAIIIWFLIPFKRLFRGRDVFAKSPVLGAAAMLALGIAAGWSSENGSAGALFLVGCMGLYYLIKRKTISAWCFMGFGGALAGFAAMLLSPGYAARTAWYSEPMTVIQRLVLAAQLSVAFSHLIFVTLCCMAYLIFERYNKDTKKRLLFLMACGLVLGLDVVICRLISGFLPRYFFLAVGAAATILLRRYYKNHRPDGHSFNLVIPSFLLITAMISALILTISVHVPRRSSFICFVFITLAAIPIVRRFIRALLEWVNVRFALPAMTALLAAFSVVSLSYTAVTATREYRQYQGMVSEIERQKSDGVYDVVIPSIGPSADSHLIMFTTWRDDPDYWVMKAICDYYGVRSVSVSGTPWTLTI